MFSFFSRLLEVFSRLRVLLSGLGWLLIDLRTEILEAFILIVHSLLFLRLSYAFLGCWWWFTASSLNLLLLLLSLSFLSIDAFFLKVLFQIGSFFFNLLPSIWSFILSLFKLWFGATTFLKFIFVLPISKWSRGDDDSTWKEGFFESKCLNIL